MFRSGGGFATTTWYPLALIAVGVAGACLIGRIDLRPTGRAAGIAAVAILGFTAWGFLSVLWADVPADAWQGANLTLLYALTFVVVAACRVPVSPARWIVLAYAAAIALVGLGTVWMAARGSGDPNNADLLGGRLAAPTSYPNATAAAFAIACWSALGLTLEERMPTWARAVALGTVTALAELNLLCQSRGSIFTLPVVVLLFLLLARRRVVAAVVMTAVGLTVAIASPALLAVYDAETAAGRRSALSTAVVAVVVSSVVLAVIGLALPRLDRVPRPNRRLVLSLRAAVAVIAAVALVAVMGLSPQDRARSAWDQFRNQGVPAGGSHLSGLGSNRYDFWRVGLAEFRDHPLIGIGVDNFVVPYVAQRRSDEQPLYPHSIVVRTLSQTGIVGTFLLLTFFGAALIAAMTRLPSGVRATVGGILTGVGAWLLHGAADWLWEMPSLGMAAFALLGLAVGMGRPEPTARDAPGRTRAQRMLVPGLAWLILVASGLSLALPWFAARYENVAADGWQADAPGALASLDRAAALNPLSDRPFVLAGAIQSRLGRHQDMRESFDKAVARNPHDWYAQLELAVAASSVGDRQAALAAAREARRLNPREAVTLRVLRGIERGSPLLPAAVDKAFLEENT